MRWQCQSCFLCGHGDFLKPLEDFGVRCPAEFVSRLLPQGAWTRCSSCARAILRGTVTPDATGEKAERAASLTHTCQACGTSNRRLFRDLQVSVTERPNCKSMLFSSHTLRQSRSLVCIFPISANQKQVHSEYLTEPCTRV